MKISDLLAFLKVELSPSKKMHYLLHWKPFKNDEKYFLLQLKSSFRSQDISVFVMTFWSWRKNGLIRRIRLTSKFLTSQPGEQTITTHMLPNISRSKDNETMKLGQLIEYNKWRKFCQKLCRKWGKLVPDLFLFLKKA